MLPKIWKNFVKQAYLFKYLWPINISLMKLLIQWDIIQGKTICLFLSSWLLESGVRITQSPAQEAQLWYILGSTGNPRTRGLLSWLLGACDPRTINVIEVSWEEVDLELWQTCSDDIGQVGWRIIQPPQHLYSLLELWSKRPWVFHQGQRDQKTEWILKLMTVILKLILKINGLE